MIYNCIKGGGLLIWQIWTSLSVWLVVVEQRVGVGMYMYMFNLNENIK